MKINLFTLIAQIVNFRVLVFLLKRFLFGRITEAMERRERRLAEQQAEAERRLTEAETARADYERRRREMETQASDLQARARAGAEALRRRLDEQVRREADERRQQWFRAVDEESEAFRAALRERTAAEMFAVIRRVLADLAGQELEQRMLEKLIGRLRTDKDLQELRAARGPVVVRTAFDVPLDAQRAIVGRLREYLPAGDGIRFESAPGLVCGAEIRVGGHKISWTADEYLRTLETEVGGYLRSRARSPGEARERKEEKVHA